MVDVNSVPGLGTDSTKVGTASTAAPTSTASATQTPQYQTGQAYSYNPSAVYSGYGTNQQFTNYPTQWNQANSTLNPIAQTGGAANWQPWYQQAQQATQQDVTDQIRQASEQAANTGMLGSTAADRIAANVASRAQTQLAPQYTSQVLNAQQQGVQNQLSAANQLNWLGGQYAQLPMTVSNNLMQSGEAMNNQQSQMLGSQNTNPWLQSSLGLMSSANNQIPQQYQQSLLSQLMGLGGTLGMGALMGG